ncbi:MAG: hypothetical protein M3Z36_02615, partial [Acidobacteriota bacterium]|nr:hypothetical protein [Acidobacteriota bacterium]
SHRKVNLVSPGTIEISDNKGNSVRLTVNPQTGLPAKAEFQAGPTAVVQQFTAFQTVDGLQLPSAIVIDQAGKKFATVMVKETKLNQRLKTDELKQKP